MAKYNGKFYFISTDENGQGRIYIRKSDILEGIKNSSETLLLDGNSYPELFKTCLWAPELHVIEGRLYIFFSGSLTNWSGVQSHVMRLSKPDYGWDNNTSFVVEGPFTIQRNGKIYLTFSGSGVDPSYCVGVMTASTESNLLDASSWRKGNYPILSSWSVPGQYGTGHNAYVYDDDGTGRCTTERFAGSNQPA